MKTLKYAWRFLIRSKSYTVINLARSGFQPGLLHHADAIYP